ncbi:MAG TPA: general secretion pathway protein GspB [Steroidobacteraceae bacterium]|jgi:general secretion pathway protein B
MSFILDALKKSESDRQRQSGPALFEVKVTPPRPRFPYWALALAVLLVINIAVGAWVFLHRPPPAETANQASVSPASTGPQSAPPQTAVAASQPAPTVITAPVPATASAGRPEPVLSNSETKDASQNPDDYAPAVPSDKQAQDQAGSHVRSGTESGLKSYADAATSPDSHMPALRVDLHVYAAKPEERFVLINMHRLHEGDSLPEGVRVESITPEGVVVSYQGAKFILEHE